LVFQEISPAFQGITAELVDRVFSRAFLDRLADADPCDLFTMEGEWPSVPVALTGLICRTYLMCNGIAQGDRLSMASSVEMRLPLVDHRLVETVVGLRKSRADYRQPAKTWFREALEGIVPQFVMKRSKRGFSPPVQAWYDALFAAYGSTVKGGFLVESGVLSEAGGDLLSAAPPGRSSTQLAFKALVLETWCRRLLS